MQPNPIVIDMDVGTTPTIPVGVEKAKTIGMGMEMSIQVVVPKAQERTVTPSSAEQIITPEQGFNALSKVTVEPIPSNYGLITWNGSTLTVS